MRADGPSLFLSATDLSAFLACRHRVALDLAAARGAIAVPRWTDPFVDLLRELGDRHEKRFVDDLRVSACRRARA